MTGTALVNYSVTRSAQHSTPVNVSIPLKSLFKYPTERDPPSNGMNTFWRGGIQNLEKEFKLEAYELLSGSGEEITTDETVVTEIPNNTSMRMNY